MHFKLKIEKGLILSDESCLKLYEDKISKSEDNLGYENILNRLSETYTNIRYLKNYLRYFKKDEKLLDTYTRELNEANKGFRRILGVAS